MFPSLPFKLSGSNWLIPSSLVSVLSSPFQSLVLSVSASGLSDPKYGCFTTSPVNPSLVFIVWVASP